MISVYFRIELLNVETVKIENVESDSERHRISDIETETSSETAEYKSESDFEPEDSNDADYDPDDDKPEMIKQPYCFKCNDCDRQFVRRHHYKMHIRTHQYRYKDFFIIPTTPTVNL